MKTKHALTSLVVVLLAGIVLASPLHAVSLVVNPSKLVVQAQPGLSPSDQPIFVTTDTGASLPFTVTFTSDASWLNVSPTSGNAGSSTVINAKIASFALQQGLYSGSITITAAADNSPVVVPVTLSVGGPFILTDQAMLTFSGSQAGTVAAQTLTVSSSNGAALNFTAAASTNNGNTTWLSVTPSSGTTTATLTVSVSTSGLDAGSYTGQITLTGSVANSPKAIAVTFNVGQGALLNAFPQALAFNGSVGQGQDPAPQTVSVQNNGAGALTVNIVATTNVSLPNTTCTAGSGWLSIDNPGGAVPLATTATVRLAGLSPGTYCGKITVTPTNGAVNGAQDIPVKLFLTATPAIGLSPTSLSFTAAAGGPIPAVQTVQLTNSGGGQLNYTVAASTTSGGPWLSVSNAGSVPATISVTANSTGLAPGSYSGTLTFTSPFAVSKTVTLPVTLTVTGQQATGITLSPSALNFYAIPNGALPNSKTVSVGTASGGQAFTAVAATSSGGTWLSVTPTSGASPGTLTVSVTTTALGAGTYNGTITVSAAGNANSPQVVAVTLRVTTTPIIVSDPASLTFSASAGVNPASQNLAFSVFGPGSVSYTFTAVANTSTGGTWLAVTPTSGNGQTTLTATATAGTLAAGTYNGSIVITSPGASNSPLTVPVTLTLNSLGSLTANPSSLQFTADPGGASQNKTVNLTISGTTAANISVTAATSSGGTWLSASASSSTTPSTITVTANAAALAAGTYNGTVTVTSGGAANSPLVINVTISVGVPTISAGGIVNGASFASGVSINAGAIVSLFGTKLAAAIAAAQALPLPTSLGTPPTQVLVNGIAAPLFYVSPTQINFAIPWELLGQTSYTVTVSNGTLTSAAATVAAAAQNPGIFLIPPGPQGAIQIANTAGVFAAPTGSIPGAVSRPIAVGEYVTIYCTGLGDVSNRPPTGVGAGGNSVATVTPSVTIGGIAAQGQFFFAGLTPGFVGLYQVNAQVPVGVQSGATVQVQITSNGFKSNIATIAVQ